MNIASDGEVVVGFKKTKIVLLILLGMGMTALGVWLCTAPSGMTGRPIWFVHAVGAVATLLFTLCSLVGFVRLCRHGPALILDREGFLDLSGGTPVGRVSWREVRGLRVATLRRSRFLVIDVHDPRRFLTGGSAWQRLLRAGNARTIGSPVALSSSTLDIGFDQLVRVAERLYGRPALGSVN